MSAALLAELEEAQDSLLADEFADAFAFASKVAEDLRMDLGVPNDLRGAPVSVLTGKSHSELRRFWGTVLRSSGIPEQAHALHVLNLAQQTQLVEAFRRPENALQRVRAKVREVVANFPRTAADIEVGRNPGDVIDPYILAATQYLMCGGDFERAIGHTVAHKALMMIEGLLGHLHEDVVGMMRGNVRAPEPRGDDQETLDPASNPFPGADVVQPPLLPGAGFRFHQVKSKTGSAKGGDGRRLGEQLQRLQDLYGGEIYYHALIGNTLRGHRSRAGVERAAPTVVVLVGSASFKELTGSGHGAELLLRVYQSAFTEIADQSGYRVETMAQAITATFQQRAQAQGEGFLESILRDVTSGDPAQQDNRLFVAAPRGRR